MGEATEPDGCDHRHQDAGAQRAREPAEHRRWLAPLAGGDAATARRRRCVSHRIDTLTQDWLAGKIRSMGVVTIFNSVAGAVPALLVILALRPVTDRELRAFRIRHSLPTQVTSAGPSTAVARSRGLRLLGAALGLSLPALVRAVTHDSFDTGSALLWGAAGYLTGALAAALMPVSTAKDGPRGATLVPRRAQSYLPLGTLVLPVVTLTLSLLAALVYVLAPRRPDAPTSTTLLGWVALCLAAASVAFAATMWVVRRKQPAPDPGVLAVDDALRSHGLRLVLATAAAVSAVAASAATLEVARATSVQLLRWTLPWLSLAEFVLAVYAWAGRDGDGWRLRPRVRL